MTNERERFALEWAESVMSAPVGSREKAEVYAAEHILATTVLPTMADEDWNGEKHFLSGATLNTEKNAEEVVMCGFTRDGEIYVVEPDGGKRGYWPMPGDLTPNGKRYELVEVTDKPENPVEPSTKTMDEYTLSERTDMVGMWAGYNRHRLGGKPTDFVIITGEENEAGRVPCYNPGAPAPHAWAPDPWMLTPRFDMPRAWGKDGEPCAPTISSNENVGPDQKEHPETLRTAEDYKDAPVGTVVAHNGCFPYVKQGRDDWTDTFDDKCSDDFLSGISRQVLRRGWGE